MRCATTVAVVTRKGRALERQRPAVLPHGEPAAEAVDQHSDLQRALGRLSTAEQEAIALRFGADMTMPEIAELQRERLTTIEGRVYRALRKLRQELS